MGVEVSLLDVSVKVYDLDNDILNIIGDYVKQDKKKGLKKKKYLNL
jgi:hypothetical protein